MPVIVSQSLYSSNPLDQRGDKAVGLAYPLTRNNTAFFNQTYTTPEAIRFDLVNLLLTKLGERPMVPEFGSALYSLLFELNTPGIDVRIEDAITDAVQRWMPFVRISNIEVLRETDPSNIYLLKVVITYSVPNVTQTTNLELLLET